MIEIIVLASFCVVISLTGIVMRRAWLRIACLVTLFMLAIGFLSMGMSGLRAHVEEARRQGASEEFVRGMVARNTKLFPRRIEIFFCMAGLLAVGLACVATNNDR